MHHQAIRSDGSETVRLPDWTHREGGQIFSLVYLSFAGGTAAASKPLIDCLSGSFLCSAFEYPGHGARWGQHMPATMSALADLIVDDLRPALKPPYVMFGHSIGAIAAFEATRRLRDRGLPLPVYL